MASISQLRKELDQWEGTRDARQKDADRRARQVVKARRRAVRHRGDTVLALRLKKAKRRLASVRAALADATAAVAKKRKEIHRLDRGTPRHRAIKWANDHLGHRESPPYSNGGPGISSWQAHFGFGRVPWCGIFVGMALQAAGVKNVTSRIAGVSLIEDDARSGRYCFSGWSTNPASARPGDAVVLFGRGVHVELVVRVMPGYLVTDGGNTSSANGGSQSNGGGSYRRTRPFSVVRGIAHVKY